MAQPDVAATADDSITNMLDMLDDRKKAKESGGKAAVAEGTAPGATAKAKASPAKASPAIVHPADGGAAVKAKAKAKASPPAKAPPAAERAAAKAASAKGKGKTSTAAKALAKAPAKLVLGCSKCRWSPAGCCQCRNPAFTGFRWSLGCDE